MHHHRLLTCLIQSICYCLHQVYACCCLHQLYACSGLHNTCCCLSVVVVLVVAVQGSPMGMLPQNKRPFTLGMMQNAYFLKKPHSILNLVLKKYEENLHHLCSKSMKKICQFFFLFSISWLIQTFSSSLSKRLTNEANFVSTENFSNTQLPDLLVTQYDHLIQYTISPTHQLPQTPLSVLS